LSMLAALGTFLGVAPAKAVVTPIGTPQFGVEPHSVTPLHGEPKLPLGYHGGPVMHSTAVYAIYWDPTRAVSWNYDGDWRALIDEYFQAVGRESGALSNVYAVAAQYTDATGGRASYASKFRGAYTDTSPYPSTGGCTDPAPELEKTACLTDAQLRAELTSFISAHNLSTGLGTIFFLLTPPGVTVCTDAGGALNGHCSDSTKQDPWAKEAMPPSPQEVAEHQSYERSFCSYHSYMGSESDPTIYAVQPWTAGNLGMYLPLAEEFGTVRGSDCQGGSEAQQEPNQLGSPGLDTDGDYDAGLADVIVNELSIEQIAAETDPLLNGWFAPAGQANAGNEVTDQCRNVFDVVPMGGTPAPPSGSRTEAGTSSNQSLGGHPYYLNDEFNQAALSMDYPGLPCLPRVALVPRFTAPSPVNAGDIAGFDAAESDISLDAGTGFSSGTPFETFPTYTWDFGDGAKTVSSHPAGASPVDEPSAFHSYQYGGTYQVTLTVTDVGGNTATVTQPVTVIGPPPPSLAPNPQPGSTSTPAASTTGSAGVKAIPAPSIYDRVGSHSLTKVLHDGLAIRYAVNEQVAGTVEVMLYSAIARRLGIHGPTAKNLPRGYPRSTVIGLAVLVTTRGGHGALKVKFPKAVARHLANAHRVKLTLRIRVRNAARRHPRTATLMSTVVLKR
jgi:hypothetical protein